MEPEPWPRARSASLVAYPRNGLASDRHQAARADLDRVPMTARTAGARDDELDRSGNTKAPPHRWLRPLNGGLSTGTAMSSTNKS